VPTYICTVGDKVFALIVYYRISMLGPVIFMIFIYIVIIKMDPACDFGDKTFETDCTTV